MRHLPLLFLSGLLALAPLQAAEIDSEDFAHLKARVNAQDESIESFRTTLQTLREELARLRSENDSLRTQFQNAKTYATQEQLTGLGNQVREVEKNRVKDKEQILEAIEKLKTLPPVVVPDPPKHTPRDKPPRDPGVKPPTGDSAKPNPTDKSTNAVPDLPSEYFEHKVAEGESLSAIIEAYNKQHGLKVRVADVLRANPKTLKDPKRIRVGQTIRIPAVK